MSEQVVHKTYNNKNNIRVFRIKPRRRNAYAMHYAYILGYISHTYNVLDRLPEVIYYTITLPNIFLLINL